MTDNLSLEEAYSAVSARLRADKKTDPLEKHTLLAIIDDRPDESHRLLGIMVRRNALGLTVITGEKESPSQPSSKDTAHLR